jgi:hypothetical protein
VLVRRVAVLEIEAALLHLEHADVALVCASIVVVLDVTRLGAAPAADAEREVERVAELHALLGPDVLDVHLDAVSLERLGLEPPRA